MRFAFHYRMPFTRQLLLLEAVQAGAERHGDVVTGVPGFDAVEDVDGLVLFGIGGISREIFDAYRNAGKRVVFLDKGYFPRGMFRVAVDDFQPRLRMKRSPERFEALGLMPRPYGWTGDTHILFDGASNKLCLWLGLGNWIEWGAAMVERIRAHTDLPIIYRPRPSHNEAVAVPGAELSTGPLFEDFARARVVVSWGGNIGFEAVVAGVPHFAIGDSVARPLSETRWDRIGEPCTPEEAARLQWLADVAWCQWSLAELADGTAWRVIREELDAG